RISDDAISSVFVGQELGKTRELIDPAGAFHNEVWKIERNRRGIIGKIHDTFECKTAVSPDKTIVENFRDLNLQIVLQLFLCQDLSLNGNLTEFTLLLR